MAHALDHNHNNSDMSAREPFGLGRIPDRNELHQGIHEDFPSAYGAKPDLSFETRQKEDYAETARVVLENLPVERAKIEDRLISIEEEHGLEADPWPHLSLLQRKKLTMLSDLGQI